MSSVHHVDGYTLTLLCNGAEYFPRLIAAIEGARESVYLETYIYADDAIGRNVAAALQRAARRGVQTHLLMDGYGSADFPKNWLRELRGSGVQVLIFRPEISWLTLRRQRLRRMHRKLVSVDGRIAFVGGINIIDDMDGDDMTQPRLDYAVEIQDGDAVLHIQAVMKRLWAVVSWLNFRHRTEEISMRLMFRAPDPRRNVMFLQRDNLRHRRDIELAYINAIDQAQHEILLANAYYLPGQRFRNALNRAAARGVKVTLLLQGKVEYWLQHYATHALYDEMLGAGMRIYEYHTSFLHAKVAVVDGRWGTVGSSNIEPFSLWLAREANLAVQDETFAATLRGDLMREIERGAYPVDPAIWNQRSVWVRLLARASYAFMKVLTSLIAAVRGKDDV